LDVSPKYELDFIQPSKLVENAFIESCNGRLRDECLNVHHFTSITDAQTKIEAWRSTMINAPLTAHSAI
jgi:putative transposase